MRRGIIMTITGVFVFISASLAQDLIISPKKIIYRRDETIIQDPIIEDGDAAANDWEAVTVIYPHVKGLLDTLLAQKIEATLDRYYLQDSLGGTPLPYLELLARKGQGLHDYRINYNKNDFLDVTFHWKLILGHLYEEFHTFVIDLTTGERVKPSDVFMNTSGLVAKLKKMQKLEVKEKLALINEYPTCSFVKRELGGRFSTRNLTNFSISDLGITFIYDYNREHICANVYPTGKYFLTWGQAKPFIKPTGLFGNFIPSNTVNQQVSELNSNKPRGDTR